MPKKTSRRSPLIAGLRWLLPMVVTSVLAALGYSWVQQPKSKRTANSAAKPNNVPWSYRHDRWKTGPGDIVQKWRAYTVSFDSADDDDGDGEPDRWGIPQWVAYEVKRFPGKLGPGPARPSWFTDESLFAEGVAPDDASYLFSGPIKNRPPYDRGHLCPKYTAYRLGDNADWNTHYLLNACPQQSDLNQGIWEDLERKVDHWADAYGQVWVVTGPILANRKPTKWLGEKGEMPVAIPDAFFKIVIKESAKANYPDVLAFVYPNQSIPKSAKNHADYLQTVQTIETMTGLDFLQALPKAAQEQVESKKASALWR